MDKRYIKLIADNFPYEFPRRVKQVVNISFIAVIIGILLLLTSEDYALYGFVIGFLGGSVLIIAGIMGMLFRKKKAKEFMAEYERTGKLPEWPEGKEKIANPQTNN